MRDMIMRLQEARDPDHKSAWIEFERQARVAFMEAAIPGIRKIAGNAAENVEVTTSRSTAWIEYKGADRSDTPLEWTAWINVLSETEVQLRAMWDNPATGHQERIVNKPAGVAQPAMLVDLFAEAFGAR